MFDTDFDPDADFDPDTFLAWLDDVDELIPPPPPEAPDFTDFADLHPAELNETGLLDYLSHLHRQIAGLHATQQHVLAAIAEHDGSVEGWSAELVSCLLREPVRTTQHNLAIAQTLTTQLPDTLHALSRGQITLRHAQIIAETAWQLPPEHIPALQHRALRRAAPTNKPSPNYAPPSAAPDSPSTPPPPNNATAPPSKTEP